MLKQEKKLICKRFFFQEWTDWADEGDIFGNHISISVHLFVMITSKLYNFIFILFYLSMAVISRSHSYQSLPLK